MNVLVVDENDGGQTLAAVVQSLLEVRSGLVFSCETVDQAYTILRNESINLVLVGLTAGPEWGARVFLQIKKEFPKEPVVLLGNLALNLAMLLKRTCEEDKNRAIEMAKTKDLLRSSRLLNSGIAHELRTPLQALLNSLELIKEEIEAHCVFREDEECTKKTAVLELVEDGLNRTDYAVKVLNSLSEYSKIASGDEVHLINVVPELKTIMRTLLFTDQFKSVGEGGFRLEALNDADDCLIPMNRVDFSQLITNLCRNAMEAIDHDDPHITVQVKRDVLNSVIITVIDNGRGIDSSLGDQIFEPYFSTKENPDSYNQGLGLAMVRDIIAAYGGTLYYDSCPGQTEFIITLPCE